MPKLPRQALFLAPVLAVMLLVPVSGLAQDGFECKCRYAGEFFLQDSCVCMKTPIGPRMACCNKVLNNSSWTFTTNACPTAWTPDPAPGQSAGPVPAPLDLSPALAAAPAE